MILILNVVEDIYIPVINVGIRRWKEMKPKVRIALVIETPLGTMQNIYCDIDSAIDCLMAVELAMEHLVLSKDTEVQGSC